MVGFDRRVRAIVLVVSLVLATSAVVTAVSVVPQATTVSGKVTLKQADGSEVPAGSGPTFSAEVVTINGTNAISGATVFSDSTVTTAKGSSAVVSLGKLGRVEVLPETTMKLSFTDSSISVSMLDSGRVRVSSSSGVAASVTTNDGQVVAGSKGKQNFVVDTSCGNTVVATQSGRVELRAGNSVKQIAAGGQDTAGTAKPGCTPTIKAGRN